MNTRRWISHPLFVPLTIQLALAYVWLSSGWEKMHEGAFVANMSAILMRFETGNPFAWYTHSFLAAAKQSPVLFGIMVQWGEVLAGIGLVASVVLCFASQRRYAKKAAQIMAVGALLGATFLNANFYYAAGWLNASTKTLNMLMFFVQGILLIHWLFRRDSYESGITSSTR